MLESFYITSIARVIYVGKEEYPEGFHRFGTNLRYHELIFHYSGSSVVDYGKVKYRRVPESLEFLPAGSYEKYDLEIEKRGDCTDVFFETNVPVSDHPFLIDMRNRKDIGEKMKRLFSLWVSSDSAAKLDCYAVLYQILADLLRNNPDKKYAKQAQIQPALTQIQERFTDPTLSLSELPVLCQISYSCMQRTFLRCFGQTPKQYLLSLRMRYAGDLLQSGRYTVGAVGEKCGFCDCYYFSRQFKKYYGISPALFSKRYRSGK